MRLVSHIDEFKSISAAARALSLDASLATRRLAGIEKRLGVRLFRRTTRSVEVTEPGQHYVEWARATLARFGEVQDAVGALTGQPSGIVRVACPELLAVRFLGPLAADFAQRHPGIRLSVLTTDRIVQLPHEQFDVAIYVGERPDNRLIVQKLLDVELLLCASPDYVARYGKPAGVAELAQHRLISHALYETGNWHFTRRGRRESHHVAWDVQTEGTLFTRALALSGAGIARLTRRTVQDDLDSGALVQLLPQHRCVLPDGSTLAAWVVFPHRQLLNRTRLFVQALRQHMVEQRPA